VLVGTEPRTNVRKIIIGCYEELAALFFRVVSTREYVSKVSAGGIVQFRVLSVVWSVVVIFVQNFASLVDCQLILSWVVYLWHPVPCAVHILSVDTLSETWLHKCKKKNRTESGQESGHLLPQILPFR
jgi:hypothetical protein